MTQITDQEKLNALIYIRGFTLNLLKSNPKNAQDVHLTLKSLDQRISALKARTERKDNHDL